MGGQTAGQKEGRRTRAALFVHTKTPLYAYTHSSLQLRPARLRLWEIPNTSGNSTRVDLPAYSIPRPYCIRVSRALYFENGL